MCLTFTRSEKISENSSLSSLLFLFKLASLIFDFCFRGLNLSVSNSVLLPAHELLHGYKMGFCKLRKNIDIHLVSFQLCCCNCLSFLNLRQDKQFCYPSESFLSPFCKQQLRHYCYHYCHCFRWITDKTTSLANFFLRSVWFACLPACIRMMGWDA